MHHRTLRIGFLALVVTLLTPIAIFSRGSNEGGNTASEEPSPQFQGRYIAAISDADMRAYAYIDGQIGEPRGVDALTIVPLPLRDDTPRISIEVSNSVVNPVFSIEASHDGATVFVAETFLPRDEDDALLSDLAVGSTLRAVDVSDLGRPTVVDAVEVGTEPQGVSMSADGRTLVLATKTPGSPLTFVSFEDGRFGEPQMFPLEGLSPMPELLDQGLFPHHAEWHPTEDIVAVTFNFRSQVQFYRVERDDSGGVRGITPWGNRVQTAKWPMSGKFSPDGRFFVTNDLQWGADVRGFYIDAPPTQLTVIDIADYEAAEPVHFVVGGVSIPQHAESFAFSNDGSLIATLNIGQTWESEETPGFSRSSLTLVSFDRETGRVAHLDTAFIDGILPEGIDFDASDTYLAAGIFEYESESYPPPAALEIWRVDRSGETPRLVRTDTAIEVTVGAHSLVVVD